MAYVYRHIRLDKNIPFYIGVGSDDKGKYSRANSKAARNKHWNDVVNKHGYRVDIIIDDMLWNEALEKEVEFISLYGRVNSGTGILVNRTDGGEGFVGLVYTEDMRKNMSISSKSPQRVKAALENMKKAHEYRDKETSEMKKARLAKMADKLRGGKRTDEQRKRMSEASKGKPKSKAHRDKMSISRKQDFSSGKRRYVPVPLEKRRKIGEYKCSEETKEKIRIVNLGRKHTEATKEKHRQNGLLRKHTPDSIAKMRIIHSERAKNRIKNYVLVYDEKMEYINKYENVRTASKALKVSSTTIYKVLNKKRETMSGYIFRMEH